MHASFEIKLCKDHKYNELYEICPSQHTLAHRLYTLIGDDHLPLEDWTPLAFILDQ